MTKKIHRPVDAPRREGLSWQERWEGEDQGLISSWENGRARGNQNPDLAARARNGELPPSAWKGGAAKPLKTKATKYASLWYLAEWQGLRGGDLDIDIDEEVQMTCSRTGVRVTYTFDPAKYSNA